MATEEYRNKSATAIKEESLSVYHTIGAFLLPKNSHRKNDICD
jgi:hypothetical protein